MAPSLILPSGSMREGVPEIPNDAASFIELLTSSVVHPGLGISFLAKLSSSIFRDLLHTILCAFQYASL